MTPLTDLKAVQDEIIAKIEEIGFEAEILTSSSSTSAVFTLFNMTSSSCVNKIETALQKAAGVINASVNLFTHEAEVHSFN